MAKSTSHLLYIEKLGVEIPDMMTVHTQGVHLLGCIYWMLTEKLSSWEFSDCSCCGESSETLVSSESLRGIFNKKHDFLFYVGLGMPYWSQNFSKLSNSVAMEKHFNTSIGVSTTKILLSKKNSDQFKLSTSMSNFLHGLFSKGRFTGLPNHGTKNNTVKR